MTTARLANFTVNLSHEQIPQQVIAVAKTCILDGLGVALAGSVDRVGKIIISYVKDLGGKPEAGVIGSRFRTCAPSAALANGVLTHALDYDDGIAGGWGGHLTAAVLPVVLALSERQTSSGKEMLEAFIAGWEVGAKIGNGIGPKLKRLGWHPHAIVGPLAAAAAGCKLLKLNEVQTRIALGISASDSVGLRANFGTDTKSLHAGKGARSGVVAALLAQKGFTASENILEGNRGLPTVLTQEEFDSAKLAEGLGSPFGLISPGLSMKPYPSCGNTQRSIDAILGLKKDYQLTAENIAEIECKTHPSIPQTLRFSHPRTATEGKFSMQYCMAAALLDGEVTLKQFTDEKVSAPKVQELMQKVKYSHPEEYTVGESNIMAQTVTVRLRDGSHYSRQIDHSRGEPQNPMSLDEITSKFRDCAQLVLKPQNMENIIELVSNLESLKDTTELMNIIIGES